MSQETTTIAPTTNSGGAPRGNRNRTLHGIRGWLSIGSYPKGAAYVRRITGVMRSQIENAILDTHGEITPFAAALIQSACRHEGKALLVQRYMRQCPDATIAEKLSMLAAIGNATDARDKCLEKMGLDRTPTKANPWSALDRLTANGHGHTASNASQPETPLPPQNGNRAHEQQSERITEAIPALHATEHAPNAIEP